MSTDSEHDGASFVKADRTASEHSRTGVTVAGPTEPGGDANVVALTEILQPERTLRRTAGLDAAQGSTASARIPRIRAGEVILDAFSVPSTEVFVVMAGSVDLWDTRAAQR